MARFDARRRAKLMLDPGIVRNRLKIDSTVDNAKAFLKVQAEFGSFDRYVWGLAGGKPIINRPKTLGDIPARTAVSDALSNQITGVFNFP